MFSKRLKKNGLCFLIIIEKAILILSKNHLKKPLIEQN